MIKTDARRGLAGENLHSRLLSGTSHDFSHGNKMHLTLLAHA